MDIGVDIVKVDRFLKLVDNKNFYNKVYSTYEINYLTTKNENKINTMAGLYSAKEAVLKALGIGINGEIKLNEVSIVHNDSGKPFVELNDKILSKLTQLGCSQIKLSISHDGDYAISECIIF